MKRRPVQQPPIDRHSILPQVFGTGFSRLCERLPKGVLTIAVLAMALLISYVDFATGNELSLLLFYLLPIGIAAWYGTRLLGVVIAVVSGVGWITGELFEQIQFHPLIFLWNSGMRISVFLVLALLLSSLRERLAEVSVQARTDPLTGLFNRRHLYERIESELRRTRRNLRPLTLVSIDVDDFKSINDNYGHVAGDRVLCAVSEVLQLVTREIDVAARTGGDEFVIILTETNDKAAREVAAKLQGALQKRMKEIGRAVTFSFGVVTFDRPPDSVDELLRMVDTQLYSAKHHGKNRMEQTVV